MARQWKSGNVIVRQRPGTAKGIVFLSLADETGIANIICYAGEFDAFRVILTTPPYLLLEGTLQNVDGIILVQAGRIRGLVAFAVIPSHDFR